MCEPLNGNCKDKFHSDTEVRSWCELPTRGEDLSVSTEPQGVDRICVAFKFSNHESMTDVPQEHSTVCRS